MFRQIPAGVGSTGAITLDAIEMDAMLARGARWAVERGWGEARDLERIEEAGRMVGAQPEYVSERAKERQRREMGTLGSGNHYLEVQGVAEIFDARRPKSSDSLSTTLFSPFIAARAASVIRSGRNFSRKWSWPRNHRASNLLTANSPARRSIRKSASATSERCGRRSIARWPTAKFSATTRGASSRTSFRNCDLRLLFDVSHNTCKVESHAVDGKQRELFVHRKGATRAFGPGHPSLPDALRAVGQPVLIGGSMGTGSYILVGEATAESKAFASACHGAGRALSRHAALKQWSGRKIVDELAERGIIIKSPSMRGVAEEAPGAYKDVSAVVAAAEQAGLARRVASLRPLICIKG